jgi:hypothetical protein
VLRGGRSGNLVWRSGVEWSHWAVSKEKLGRQLSGLGRYALYDEAVVVRIH